MQRLTALCVRYSWLTLLVALLATVAAGRGALWAEPSVGLAATLGADDPMVREFKAFLDRFGGGYSVLVAYECATPAVCGTALDPAALEMAAAVTQQLRRAPAVSRVSSPATSPLLVSSAGGLEVRRCSRTAAAPPTRSSSASRAKTRSDGARSSRRTAPRARSRSRSARPRPRRSCR
jgi:predicted RND superfamily exporter protein